MRAGLVVVALLLAGCGTAEPSQRGAGLANLVVRVDADGDGPAAARELRLRCDDPRQSAACGAAAGVSQSDLAPVPGDKACAQVYGGPDTARIAGTLRGEAVDARFSRVDSCETARWQGVQDLLSEVR